MFFNLFSKKEPEQSKPAQNNSIFSTHMPAIRSKMAIAMDALRNITPTSLNANIIQSEVGMDSDDPKSSMRYGAPMGSGLNEALLGWYGSQTFIGYQACYMLAQNWLIDKACSVPAEDAVRNGYEITVNDGTEVDPDVIDAIYLFDKERKIKEQMIEFERNCRIFGVRVALFVVDGIDYEKPFNIDGVKAGSYKGISQIDPYWMVPWIEADDISDPARVNFYEPEYWTVAGKKYHKSHLCIIRHKNVADVIKPMYLYGGIPLPQMIAERVYAAERTANEAPLLVMTKRTNVFKIDTSQGIADQAQLENKLRNWAYYRDNYGIKAINLEEEIQQFDTALADVDTVIMTQYQLVAAIACMPATKLLGTSPKGFNATGDYDFKSYHEFLEGIQENHLTQFVDRHHQLTIASEIAPKFGIKPFSVSISWKSLDIPTAKEQAEINQLKAQTDNALSQSGAIDGVDVRARIIKDPESGYNGISDVVPEMPDQDGDQLDG